MSDLIIDVCKGFSGRRTVKAATRGKCRDHNLIVKAMREPKSLRAAINAMCFHCMGGTDASLPDPGWEEAIGRCTSAQCPLAPHRPYKQINGQPAC